mgnify:CR=1 FL=1
MNKLEEATINGDLECVKKLLLNKNVRYKCWALHKAIKNGHDDIVRAYVEDGRVSVYLLDLLKTALENEDYVIFEILLTSK